LKEEFDASSKEENREEDSEETGEEDQEDQEVNCIWFWILTETANIR
jgi:hypothetical protein